MNQRCEGSRWVKRSQVEEDADFFNRVVAGPNNCHLWTGSRGKKGYGMVRWRGGRHRAHRVAWMLENGPIPPNALVRHACDTPSCVNPRHLLTGSAADNSGDMVSRGRSCRGERNAGTSLTDACVTSMRRRVAEGETVTSVAASVGMSVSGAARIVRGDTWRHVGGPRSGRNLGPLPEPHAPGGER